MAKLSNDAIPGFEQKPDEDFFAYMDRTDNLLKTMQEKEAALPEGTYEGVILAFPVADGAAMYLVQKTRPLTLQHIPVGDAWQIPAAHLRGLNMDDVKQHVKRNSSLRAMFSRKT